MLFALILILRIEPVSSLFASQSDETLTQNPDLGKEVGSSSSGGNPGDIGAPRLVILRTPAAEFRPVISGSSMSRLDGGGNGNNPGDIGAPPPCDPQDPTRSFAL